MSVAGTPYQSVRKEESFQINGETSSRTAVYTPGTGLLLDWYNSNFARYRAKKQQMKDTQNKGYEL